MKNSIGNGEANDLICMTHGHELSWGNDGGRAGTGQRGIKGRKKWDNCNSLINKIYLKTEFYWHMPHPLIYNLHGVFRATMAESSICNRDWPQSQTYLLAGPLPLPTPG